MALMILAHPNYKQSIANKTIAETLQKSVDDLELRNIYQLYPDYQIDIEAEQAALLKHDLIILQYPMYWFNMPAILKIWFDKVFTYQFAYGSQGDKLKNKKLLPSLTVGQPEQNFQSDNHFLIDDFMCSLKKTAEYAQMNYLKPVILYDISIVTGHTELEITQKAKAHSQKLHLLIKQYDSVKKH
ncbi:NAD(P)H-dependent oxidoreductase [Entomomonas asaccharolytica]|uniref:NAD(P)H-dependent oxidoreductase n=1 Tax=Entomomonas asaccharolytica TaxID=2785331 RepID=A0A974NG15_9GAMM|nr:NAD(P)H-dependent oxidoreductase [Entomomonas asaccharolytica]QQP86111.1 NAD(P)H-dependent oxidoreductase [Entomomonas asaccharolytica]